MSEHNEEFSHEFASSLYLPDPSGPLSSSSHFSNSTYQFEDDPLSTASERLCAPFIDHHLFGPPPSFLSQEKLPPVQFGTIAPQEPPYFQVPNQSLFQDSQLPGPHCIDGTYDRHRGCDRALTSLKDGSGGQKSDCIQVGGTASMTNMTTLANPVKSLDPSSHPLLEDLKKVFTGEEVRVLDTASKMTGCGELDLFMLSTLQTIQDLQYNYSHIFDSLDRFGSHLLKDFQTTCDNLKVENPSQAARSQNCVWPEIPYKLTNEQTKRHSLATHTHLTGYDLDPSKAGKVSTLRLPAAQLPATTDSEGKTALSAKRSASNKKSSKLPEKATAILKKWLFDHSTKPYPDEDEKQQLCLLTGLSLTQLNNWFINARRRILQCNKAK